MHASQKHILMNSFTAVKLKVPHRNQAPDRNLLFDLRPKRSRKDLFDREREIEKASSKYPLIMLLGVKRWVKLVLLTVS